MSAMFGVTPHLARLGPDPDGDVVTVLALDDHLALVITVEGKYKFAPHKELRAMGFVLPGPTPGTEHEHELGEAVAEIEGSRLVGTIRRCTVAGCDYVERKFAGAPR